MRKTFSLVVALFLSTSSLVSVQAQVIEINNMNQAIEEAAGQTTLTQRIMKGYGLILLGVKASKYQKELTDSINRYEAVISELENFPAAAEAAQESLEKARRQWKVVKKIAEAQPSIKRAGPLESAMEQLLEVDDEIVTLLTESANIEDTPLLVLSDRQAMLSQRIASLYMLRALGVLEEDFIEAMENATFEFQLGGEELQGAEINNKEINKLLKKVKSQFRMLEFSVNKKGRTHFPFVVSQAAEKIFDQMIKVNDTYVELLNKGS